MLDTNSEFILGVMSIVAQGENEQKSASITWSVIEGFKRGNLIIPTHNLDTRKIGMTFMTPAFTSADEPNSSPIFPRSR